MKVKYLEGPSDGEGRCGARVTRLGETCVERNAEKGCGETVKTFHFELPSFVSHHNEIREGARGRDALRDPIAQMQRGGLITDTHTTHTRRRPGERLAQAG